MSKKFDFFDWVKNNDLSCFDGHIDKQSMLKEDDSKIVPLTWTHQRNSPENVIGHVVLEKRSDGEYYHLTLIRNR